MKILIRQFQCPGDLLMLSAAIRDLKAARPLLSINVETACNAIFDNNPHLDRSVTASNADRVINLEYPLIHQSDRLPFHFIHAFRMELETHLNITIPQGAFRGEIFLSAEERKKPEGLPEKYWIVDAGYKNDYPLKNWGFANFQRVIELLSGKVKFVQIGALEHNHRALDGVVNMIGLTNTRQLCTLMYHASGVLTPVSFPMHLCAAVPTVNGALRPAVVVAGGREPVHWEQYPAHQFMHTVGALDCCRHGGCWRGKATGCDRPCAHPTPLGDELVGKCMTLITPERVAEMIQLYNN